MRLIALIPALLMSYHWPLPAHLRPALWSSPFARLLERNLNNGQSRNGWIAWGLAALFPAVGVAVFACWLDDFSQFAYWLFSVLVLYFLLDNQGFIQPAEQIAASLRDFNIPQARQQLRVSSGDATDAYGSSEISRVTIENAITQAHYGLFAPIFWFAAAGPGGIVLYRLSQLLSQCWKQHGELVNPALDRVFGWLDWVPVHLTAICYAVVGDFEDAMYCWRTQAGAWPDKAKGILLTSGAGALGVVLGNALPRRGILEARPEIGLGDTADADAILSAVGLVWRVLVLLLVLILLLTFANWLGS